MHSENGQTVQALFKTLSSSMQEHTVAVTHNGVYLDFSHVVPDDADVVWIDGRSAEGLDVLRHSTAHLMAHAVKDLYPAAQVVIGPVIEITDCP